MKGRTFNTANLPVCLIDFNYTRDTNTAKFDSYFRHFGESVIFVFRQTKSKFAHGEWRSLSANPAALAILLMNTRIVIITRRQHGNLRDLSVASLGARQRFLVEMTTENVAFVCTVRYSRY